MDEQVFVWVFVGEAGEPGAVFSSTEVAESWISKWMLTGVLTRYPLDAGAYDWCVVQGLFTPKKEEHKKARFVGSFVSASMPHEHYEMGVRLT